jgi:hypothetical protein
VIGSLFIELGSAIVRLALLARLAGLAFGNGGLLPLGLSTEFIHIGAEIGKPDPRVRPLQVEFVSVG